MPIKARKLGPGQFTVGDTGTPREFGAQLSKAALTPKTDSEDPIKTLDGSKQAGDADVSWTFAGTMYQDYDKDSIEDFCYDNQLKQLPFTFIPSNEGTRAWKGELVVVPVQVGGDVDKRNTSDFEFEVVTLEPIDNPEAPSGGGSRRKQVEPA